jgi:hypothetical protein
MIAGTYPFIAQMKGDLVATGLLIGVWLTAVAGIILKLLLPGRFDCLAVVLYAVTIRLCSFVWRMGEIESKNISFSNQQQGNQMSLSSPRLTGFVALGGEGTSHGDGGPSAHGRRGAAPAI